MSAPVQFTCSHCGQDVPFMDSGLLYWEPRNQCPGCLWSRHVMFGCPGLRPCGAMMRPVLRSPDRKMLIQRCEGCGFRWVSYDEDWWASLPPGRQSELFALTVAETEIRNGRQVLVFPVRQRYRVQISQIPAELIGTRTRVASREPS